MCQEFKLTIFQLQESTEFTYCQYDQVHFESFSSIGRFMSHLGVLLQTSRAVQSRRQVICKKDVLRNFSKFTGKHLCQSLFYNKTDYGTGVILWILRNSKNTFLYRTPLVAASGTHSKVLYGKAIMKNVRKIQTKTPVKDSL